VEYRHFTVNAFQQRPGKWRASVRRSDGTPLAIVGPHKVKIAESVTHIDSLTAEDALRMAIDAIEAGAFSHQTTLVRSTEVATSS
jgi:hypothetical protein